ncbi:hypothetical protein CDAR_431261 [Caerostris darwini]|uniref:Uncharacterized protein n=1 Tax=Caerostris darwini TaxID=1538125 RepID=A0AAV4RT78_9ARAC|nr:hypothetical protein CDAR_431261 [Caerostris darwini]
MAWQISLEETGYSLEPAERNKRLTNNPNGASNKKYGDQPLFVNESEKRCPIYSNRKIAKAILSDCLVRIYVQEHRSV